VLVERRDLIKETFNHRSIYSLNPSVFIPVILNRLICVSDSKQTRENGGAVLYPLKNILQLE
jgi:hypothetical protein